MIARLAVVLISTLLLANCDDFPKDAAGTLERVQSGGPLRVGWSPAPPWVRLDDTPADGPAGPGADLLRAWAAAERIRIEWVAGGEAQLVRGLQKHILDIALAGFLESHPWGARVGNTRPYLVAEIVVGAAPGTRVPDDWDGVEIRYDRRRPQIGAVIRAIGAEPLAVAPGDSLAPIGAAYASELTALGLELASEPLSTERHVIVTPAGENALTYALDRFLHARQDETRKRVAAGAWR